MHKRYKKDLIITFIFCLITGTLNTIFFFISNFLPKITISNFNDYKDSGIFDGFQGYTAILPTNITLIAVVILIAIILAIKLKDKIVSIVSIIVIIVSLLVTPITIKQISGGMAGVKEKQSCSIIFCRQIK